MKSAYNILDVKRQILKKQATYCEGDNTRTVFNL
jgi:hypothetical protein